MVKIKHNTLYLSQQFKCKKLGGFSGRDCLYPAKKHITKTRNTTTPSLCY